MNENTLEMNDNLTSKKKAIIWVRIIFGIRILLWTVALAATVYWIYYSFKLTSMGIFEPEEYSPLLKPVLYTGVCIAVTAIAVSFILYAVSKKIKIKHDI